MSSAYGKINRPSSFDVDKLRAVLPIETKTKKRQVVTIHWLNDFLNGQIQENQRLKIVTYLQGLLNNEISAGNSYPQEFILNLNEFSNYFLSADAFIVVNGEKTRNQQEIFDNPEENVLGTFYIKPNFPGRCSHICNGGFVTALPYRNRGIGKVMGLAFIKIAPLLGYRASMFNLVFSSNIPSIRLWKSLNFKEIGRVPNAGRLIAYRRITDEDQIITEEDYFDAVMFYYSFT